MKKDEVNKIISMLVTAYPSQFKKMDSDTIEKMVCLYELSFKNDSYETVRDAVISLIGKMKFLPNIAEIREEMPDSPATDVSRLPLPDWEKRSLAFIYGNDAVPAEIVDSYKHFAYDPPRKEFLRGVQK